MDLTKGMLSLTLMGGGWVLWLLAGLSVLSLAVMVERLWYLARYRPDEGRLAEDMRALLGATPPAAAPERATLNGALEGVKARERMRLERNLAYLATLGSNAPFIGLLGTVLGIIKAFHDLAADQGGGPSVVMAGISEALVATAFGLLVAIPAVVAFNFLTRRVRTKMAEVDWRAQLALARLQGAGAAPAQEPA
jgi:biopolymer transport protein ExbB